VERRQLIRGGLAALLAAVLSFAAAPAARAEP